jgi:hypothetical protein
MVCAPILCLGMWGLYGAVRTIPSIPAFRHRTSLWTFIYPLVNRLGVPACNRESGRFLPGVLFNLQIFGPAYAGQRRKKRQWMESAGSQQGTNGVFRRKKKEKHFDMRGILKICVSPCVPCMYTVLFLAAAPQPTTRDPRSTMQHTAHRFFVRRAAKSM